MPLYIYSTSFQLILLGFLREILATCQITEKELPTELVLLPWQIYCSLAHSWEVSSKVTKEKVFSGEGEHLSHHRACLHSFIESPWKNYHTILEVRNNYSYI